MKNERKLGMLGKKLGMTRVFEEDGAAAGVTVVHVGPCLVLGKRTVRKDGYSALIVGFDDKPTRKVNKPEAGMLKEVGGVEKAKRFVKEMRLDATIVEQFQVGQEITVKDLGLKAGDLVDVVGTTKGKGFQGVMKRHHFAGFPATHGTHEYFRHGGSIGCRKWPGRVFKNRRMPGHMGDRRVTTQNIRIVAIREEDNAILLHGSIPGAKQGYVVVSPAIKRRAAAA